MSRRHLSAIDQYRYDWNAKLERKFNFSLNEVHTALDQLNPRSSPAPRFINPVSSNHRKDDCAVIH